MNRRIMFILTGFFTYFLGADFIRSLFFNGRSYSSISCLLWAFAQDVFPILEYLVFVLPFIYFFFRMFPGWLCYSTSHSSVAVIVTRSTQSWLTCHSISTSLFIPTCCRIICSTSSTSMHTCVCVVRRFSICFSIVLPFRVYQYV